MDEPTVEMFLKLNPRIRCVALSGYFLQYWSVLESNINNAIERGLDLTMLQGAVLTKNIQFRDKINILKTLVDLRGVEVDRLQSALESASKMSTHRNMIAHDMFVPDDDGDGVRFVVIRARGKLSFPETRWSIADFMKKYIEIAQLTSRAEEISAVISQVTLAKMLKEAQDPNAWPQGLGLLNTLVHRLPDSHQATDETEPGTQTGRK